MQMHDGNKYMMKERTTLIQKDAKSGKITNIYSPITWKIIVK